MRRTVQRLLSFVLAPASAITGISVPSAEHLSAIRFANGSGENAAPWLHLYAATIVLFVLLPRALLASIAGWHEVRLTNQFPLSTDDAYFQRLLRAHRGERAPIRMVPYSYKLSPQATLGVNAIMTRIYGSSAEVSFAPAIAFGGEDVLPADLLPAHRPALVAVLFALTATPEAEHHNALINAVGKRVRTGTPIVVIIDESGFRERFGEQSERWKSVACVAASSGENRA
jgi:hypothetical protein